MGTADLRRASGDVHTNPRDSWVIYPINARHVYSFEENIMINVQFKEYCKKLYNETEKSIQIYNVCAKRETLHSSLYV